MKNLIICVSIHHGNTEKIAKAMAEILNAKLAKPNEVTMDELSNYDLIGFGSGIYAGEHHETLLDFADKLFQLQNKKAFIFSTRGILPVRFCHKSLRKKLLEKKFDVIGEFSCRGLLTEWLLLARFSSSNSPWKTTSTSIRIGWGLLVETKCGKYL